MENVVARKNHARPKMLMLEDMCKDGRELLEKVFDLDYTPKQAYYDGVYVKLKPSTIINCNFVACPCTGTDHLTLELGIKLLKLEDKHWLYENIYATAEHTFALMLSLIRNISKSNENIVRGRYDRDLFVGTELRDKTIGIIGYGRVGMQVANIAKGFGMRVLIYDNCNSSMCLNISQLAEILHESDIISIHASLNITSVDMFCGEIFSNIKKGAYLINTARSSIVNAESLLMNLKNGHLGGAALDVMENYTYAEKKALRKYSKYNDNLILTPHIGGNTIESRIKTDIYIANKVLEYWESVGSNDKDIS